MASSSTDNAIFNITKLDGTNYGYWKSQIWQVLVQKDHVKPLRLSGQQPASMTFDDWDDLDAKCKSTIILSLTEQVHYNVVDEAQSAWQLWEKIKNLYDKKSPASQMYWLKKLMDLRMSENATMSAHLSSFHVILKNLTSQGITFPEEVTPLFLLGTLGESWDVFRGLLGTLGESWDVFRGLLCVPLPLC